MEVPRLGVESELQLPAYTTAAPMHDLSLIFDLYHSSWQCWIPNPLSEAGDQTCILMDTSQIHLLCAITGTLSLSFLSRMEKEPLHLQGPIYQEIHIELGPPQL